MLLKPEQQKISAYYNLDNGAGKIRGIYLQGDSAAGPIFKAWLAPFADLGASYSYHQKHPAAPITYLSTP